MATVNGIGTVFYGWHHNPDGTATVTKWAVLFWLPLIPVGRYRIRMLNDPDSEPAVTGKGVVMAALGGGAVCDYYDILERLPLDWSSILTTYAKAYIGLPILLSVPAVLAGLVLWGLVRLEVLDREGDVFMYVTVGVMLVYMGYFFSVLATILHRSRGGRK